MTALPGTWVILTTTRGLTFPHAGLGLPLRGGRHARSTFGADHLAVGLPALLRGDAWRRPLRAAFQRLAAAHRRLPPAVPAHDAP